MLWCEISDSLSCSLGHFATFTCLMTEISISRVSILLSTKLLLYLLLAHACTSLLHITHIKSSFHVISFHSIYIPVQFSKFLYATMLPRNMANTTLVEIPTTKASFWFLLNMVSSIMRNTNATTPKNAPTTNPKSKSSL